MNSSSTIVPAPAQYPLTGAAQSIINDDKNSSSMLRKII